MRTFLLAGLLLFSAAQSLADADELAERRRDLAAEFDDYALLILLPEESRVRSNDVDWPYRQGNDFYYLTHSTHLDTHFMLVKEKGDISEYLFATLSDPEYEVWEGRLPTKETLQENSGVATVWEEAHFSRALQRLLNGKRLDPDRDTRMQTPEHLPLFRELLAGNVEVWLELGRSRGVEHPSQPTPEQQLAAVIKERFPELRIRNVSPLIEAMRRVKSESEVAIIQRAIDITGAAHHAAMRRALEAEHEYQVQATIDFTFRDLGGCCWAFPSIVATGDNATILHYVDNDAPLQRGELLLADIGAEIQHYGADVTRTFPISGRFSADQRLVYDAVYAGQQAAIAAARPGVGMEALTDISMRRMAEDLLTMGLITEDTDEQVKSYFLHGLGHSLGLDTHDAFEYHLELAAGMVVTIEPGIYVRPDDVREKDWYKALDEEASAAVDAALERFAGIGVRIEDDILITRRGNRNLSADIPADPDEIEAVMAEMAELAAKR